MKNLITYREQIKNATSSEHLYGIMHDIAGNERFNFNSSYGYKYNADSARMQGRHGVAELFTLAANKVREWL